jgi:hypothetical protein
MSYPQIVKVQTLINLHVLSDGDRATPYQFGMKPHNHMQTTSLQTFEIIMRNIPINN